VIDFAEGLGASRPAAKSWSGEPGPARRHYAACVLDQIRSEGPAGVDVRNARRDTGAVSDRGAELRMGGRSSTRAFF